MLTTVVSPPSHRREAQDLRSLEHFLRQHGALLNGLTAASGSSEGGRGVVATRDFQVPVPWVVTTAWVRAW